MTTLWDRDRAPRLLFVEDDTDIGNMFKIYFGSTADVTVASHAEEVLALFSPYSFDLVILDFGVPDLDEYEFLRSIRASGNKVPVLFLTQKDGPSEKLQSLEIDADDYLVKPFDIEELRLRIRGMLNRLAGDTTTDAPPPKDKKKIKGK